MKNLLHSFKALVLISILFVQCKSNNHSTSEKPILTHWLQGTWEYATPANRIVEDWSHPSADYWQTESIEMDRNGTILSTTPIEIKNHEDVLSLFIEEEGITHILPSKKVDTDIFEFENESDGYRIKFDLQGESTYRRVHYRKIDGQNNIEFFRFEKVIDKAVETK